MKNMRNYWGTITRAITSILAIAIINLVAIPATATAELPSSAQGGLRAYSNAQQFFASLKRDASGNIVVAGQQGEDIAALSLANGGKLIQSGKLNPSTSARKLLEQSGGERVFVRGLLKDDRTGRVLDARYAASKDQIQEGVKRDALIVFLKGKGIQVRDTP